jgi:hypothetical protein
VFSPDDSSAPRSAEARERDSRPQRDVGLFDEVAEDAGMLDQVAPPGKRAPAITSRVAHETPRADYGKRLL